MKPLTNLELDLILKEVREIAHANELLDESRDQDILDRNLARLSELEATLIESLRLARISGSGLKLIRGAK